VSIHQTQGEYLTVEAAAYQALLAEYTAVSGAAAISIALGFKNIRAKKGYLELQHFISQ
jgi:hypothetical protein